MDLLRDREAFQYLTNRATTHANWYQIVNKSDDEAEVFIYSEIGWIGATAEEFINELRDITAERMSVRINSGGGSVFDGIAIYNAIRSHPAYVTTQVDALAASIASVIAQAGDHRIMMESSEMMIHEAKGIALGATAENMRELADILDTQTEKIADIYAKRKGDGRSKKKFLNMMRAGSNNMGTWFSPEEAVAEGLADEVLTPPKRDNKLPDPIPEPEPVDNTTGTVDFGDLFDRDDFEWWSPDLEGAK